MADSTSVPTGCFKCGRPGHWSRDCPSSSAATGTGTAQTGSQNPKTSSFKAAAPGSGGGGGSGSGGAPKPKRGASRPKLTPELLLSDDGLGYILRYFPRAFKCRGRGYEERDLGNLIRLYEEWHSQLLPYYPFDQFVPKVEQVAARKRVKLCIKELRERVANGADPTKLHERHLEHEDVNMEQGAMHPEAPDGGNHQSDPISEDHHADDAEDMLDEIYEQTTGDINSSTIGTNGVPSSSEQQAPNQGADGRPSCPNEVSITEEQRARIEANKQKAVEKAASSSSAQINLTEEQRARMEANKLKALERAAAARARSSSQAT